MTLNIIMYGFLTNTTNTQLRKINKKEEEKLGMNVTPIL